MGNAAAFLGKKVTTCFVDGDYPQKNFQSEAQRVSDTGLFVYASLISAQTEQISGQF